MRKTVLLAGAIIWGLIALAILGFFILGMTGRLDKFNIPFFSGGNFGMEFASSTELVKEQSFSIKSLETIDISTSHHSIAFNLVDGDKLTVRQYDSDAENLFTALSGAKSLEIKVQPRNIAGFMAVSYNPRLEIDLPRDYAAAMKLSSSSGSINSPDNFSLKWGDSTISTSSGSVRLGGLSCGALELSTGSGSVNLGDIHAERVTVTTNSGTLRLEDIVSRGEVFLKSGSGSINAGETSATDFTVSTNSGTLRLDSIEVSGRISMESGSGSVNCEDLSGITIEVKSNSGTLHLGDITAAGNVVLGTGSGSHNVGELSCESFEISSNSGTLRYEEIKGAGSVTSGSGSVTCEELDIRGSCFISSNSGTLRLSLADNPSFELEISTNSGSIRADGIDLMYKSQRGNEAVGTVGGGKNGTLTIKTGSGSINID